LYCIGGRNGGTKTTSVYYDKLWPEPSDWNSTTPYPLAGGRSCVIYQRTIYCISEPTGNSTTDPVYYAQVSGGLVIGGWKQTTSYPIAVTGESCVTFEGYVYCMTGLKVNSCCATGDVYYARLSDGGIQGSWLRATSIPGFGYGSCVVALSSIWCDWGGGIVHNVILGPSTPTVTTTEKVASAIATVTTTATTLSSSGQAVGFASTPVIYALIGTTVLLAVSTLFFATRRKESGG